MVLYQGLNYPECKDCRVSMDVPFLQINPDDVFRMDWGDDATGYVTLCPECKKPGFEWAA